MCHINFNSQKLYNSGMTIPTHCLKLKATIMHSVNERLLRLNLSFNVQLCRDSNHSLGGVTRRYGCWLVFLNNPEVNTVLRDIEQGHAIPQ